MKGEFEILRAAASRVTEHLLLDGDAMPRLALICGTGFGQFAEILEPPVRWLSYAEVEGLRPTVVEGHDGRLLAGRLFGRTLLCCQGRLHAYEGHTSAETTRLVRLLALIGVDTLLLTSAVGSISRRFLQDDFVLVNDHFSLPAMAGLGPLVGPNDPRLGPRFLSMSEAYDASLRQLASSAATEETGASLKEGVYAQIAGPQFETPAEVRLLRAVGADVVGMSLAHETIVARHCGLRVLALALVTNEADDGFRVAGPPPAADEDEDDVHRLVLRNASRRADVIRRLLYRIIDAVYRTYDDANNHQQAPST